MVLHDWHGAAGAEFQAYGEAQIVSTYGALALEYAAIYRSAAIMEMSQRAALRVSGPDRFTFLNSLLTAEIVSHEGARPLANGQARFSFLLDRKGRIQAEMNVLIAGDSCILEMDRRLIDPITRELEKYHFREKVEISPIDGCEIAVLGPAAAKLLQAVDLAQSHCTAGGAFAAEVLWRDDLSGVPCYYMLVSNSSARDAWTRLIDASAIPIGWAACNTLRIEAARPLLGVDYDDSFLPAETGQLDRAVSFTKGCYPGQEIVARMQSRDQLARRVAQLRTGLELPIAGQGVLDDTGAQIGVITSSTISPRQSSISLCLAVLKKPFFEPGTKVRVPAEGALRDAVVVK